MRDVCIGANAKWREFNGETDHVHLLVHYPPSLAPSVLVNQLKGVSSRLLRQHYPAEIRKYLWGKYFWSPSYFAASRGGAPLTVITISNTSSAPTKAASYAGRRTRSASSRP
jgi:putative transposase